MLASRRDMAIALTAAVVTSTRPVQGQVIQNSSMTLVSQGPTLS